MIRILFLVLITAALPNGRARSAEPPAGSDSIRVAVIPDSLRWPEPGDVAGEWLAATFAAPAPRRDSLADVRAELARCYLARDYRRLWSRGNQIRPQAVRLVAALGAADRHGLDPTQFDAEALRLRIARLRPPWLPPSPVDLARLDVMLSASAIRYAGALAGGRVPPRIPHPTLRTRVLRLDRVAALDSIAGAADPWLALEALAPRSAEYQRLRDLLGRYRGLERDSALERLEKRRRPLHPGERFADAGRLRQLLWFAGVIPDTAAALARHDSLVTRAMIAAARALSRRDSLPFDGTIGAPLAWALQQDLIRRQRLLRLALERQRWLTREFPSPPIVVNIPSFEMCYWRDTRDDSGSVMRMRVCVGGADSTQTPPLSDRLRAIVFRPNWNIPPSIMRKEIKPKALEDSTYLAKNHYELVDIKSGKVLEPTPARLDAIGLTLRVRQKSGEGNALGDIKFMLSNSEAIYMHDTPMRAPFRRARRDVSHGCVRLQEAHTLARYLLRDRPDWPPERIEAAAKNDSATTVPLTDPIPVEIVYWTAVTRPTGGLDVFADIYHHDATLDSLLQLRYPLPK